MEKDKILLTLVDKVRRNEAASKAQAEAQKLEIKDLQKRFPKLEAGLCAMTKDDLADSLAYNSLKVRGLRVWKFYDLQPIPLFLYQLFYI